MSAAGELKSRLRTDLKEAMKARQAVEAKLIRTLLAALDNAEAPAQSADQASAVGKEFSAGGAETARLDLTQAQLENVLRTEIASRVEVADELARRDRAEAAAALRAEAEAIQRYL